MPGSTRLVFLKLDVVTLPVEPGPAELVILFTEYFLQDGRVPPFPGAVQIHLKKTAAQ